MKILDVLLKNVTSIKFNEVLALTPVKMLASSLMKLDTSVRRSTSFFLQKTIQTDRQLSFWFVDDHHSCNPKPQ